MAIEAIKNVVNNDKVTIELKLENSKTQKVTVKSGNVSEDVSVNLTIVPNKNNQKELKFEGSIDNLRIIVFEGGKNTRYTLDNLKNHEDGNIKALAEKITVKDNKIIIPEILLTTDQWSEIKAKEGSKILRAYRVTIVDSNGKIGKIAMYENGQAVIESK